MAYARRGDPWTSWEAADRVHRVTETQHAILDLFREHGPMTDTALVACYQDAIRVQQVPRAEPSGIRSRRDELVAEGLVRNTGKVVRGRTNRPMIVWGLNEGPTVIPLCSCGRGPVGHVTYHESTETPGIVRVTRPGKTDQYVDVRKAEAQGRAARRPQQAQAPVLSDPLIPHPQPVFGRMFCKKCKGHGGTVVAPCRLCDGTGYAR